MSEATEVNVRIERVTPGSDEWCVPCPFCEWARKSTKPSELLVDLVDHMNSLHKGGSPC